MSAKKQLPSRNHRKGNIEVETLVIWIILFVFLILVMAIVMLMKTGSTEEVNSLCQRTGGLIGC